jgi:hypothetical protein
MALEVQVLVRVSDVLSNCGQELNDRVIFQQVCREVELQIKAPPKLCHVIRGHFDGGHVSFLSVAVLV